MVAGLSWATSFLHSLFAFVIILVPLVVFHEFGHYVFARIFGVKAEIFSVGFGPRLWSRQFGETEFRLSAIPLGGYVKLLGEDKESELSPEEQARSLTNQKPWKRFFIFLGGPLFNFILAIFIFMCILVIGEPQMSSVIGRVVHGSPAEKMGFLSGDRIVSINDKPVHKFEEIILAINESPNVPMDFKVIHARTQMSQVLRGATSSQTGFSIYGESKSVGEIDGLLPIARSNQLGISDPKSPAAQAGLVTGDKVTALQGRSISSWEDLEEYYTQIRPGTPMRLEFTHAKSEVPKTVEWVKPQDGKDLGSAFGLYSSELFVEKVVPKSPAEAAGVKSGDRLIGVGPREVQSFFELKDAVQASGEKDGKVLLSWERSGQKIVAEINPTATTGRDPVLKKTTQFTVGVMPMLTLAEPDTITERILNPVRLVYTATERMVVYSWRNLVSLRKIVTGDVSVGALGGPIMIGKIAGESLTRGLIAFLTNMAIFSIGLGVLNILPVPVLDGGHLMLLGVEMVRGRPLSVRQMEIVQGVGLVLILALMGIAFHNDISRLVFS